MTRYIINLNNTSHVVDVTKTGADEYSVAVDPTGPAPAPVVVAAPAAAAPKPAAPAARPAAPAAPKPAAAAAGKGPKFTAPMPGTIDSIAVSVGSAVKKGDTILVLEAMKMKNDLKSDVDGTIASINVAAGQQVKFGEVLATFE